MREKGSVGLAEPNGKKSKAVLVVFVVRAFFSILDKETRHMTYPNVLVRTDIGTL